MYLVVTFVVIAVILVRFVLQLAGFKLRPWSVSRRWQYRIDAVIAGLILLGLAVGIGLRPSFPMALGIAVLAVVIAAGLEAMRKKMSARSQT